MGQMLQPSSRSYHLAATSCLHTLRSLGVHHGACFPDPSQAPWAPETCCWEYTDSLAVTCSPNETFWQLETLNANLTPFSLLFINSPKMGHFPCQFLYCWSKKVAAALWVDYHCHIPSSIIWYASHIVLWSGNSPEYKLIYTFSIMAFVSSAALEYITCSWNRSPASHSLPSSCKKNKKQGKERDHLSFYIAGFVSRPSRVHNSLLAVKYFFPARPWKQPREVYKYQRCKRWSISVTEKCFWVLKCLPCLERVCTCLTERKIHPQFCHSRDTKCIKSGI